MEQPRCLYISIILWMMLLNHTMQTSTNSLDVLHGLELRPSVTIYREKITPRFRPPASRPSHMKSNVLCLAQALAQIAEAEQASPDTQGCSNAEPIRNRPRLPSIRAKHPSSVDDDDELMRETFRRLEGSIWWGDQEWSINNTTMGWYRKSSTTNPSQALEAWRAVVNPCPLPKDKNYQKVIATYRAANV